MNFLYIKNGTKKGYLKAYPYDGVDLAFPKSKTRRGRVQPQMCQTLDTAGGGTKGVVMENLEIRKLTPKECGRLMGIKDSDIDKMNISNTQMYKQFGNAIVVDVLYYVFKEMM